MNKCNWNKASNLDIHQYQLNINDKLSRINITGDTYSCTNCHCDSIQHKYKIDYLCKSIIESCIQASNMSIPPNGSGG